MKWKNKVEIKVDIDMIWEVIWNRTVLEESVNSSVLVAEYVHQRVYAEHYENEGFHQNYLVTLSILLDTAEFKIIHCCYTFNNAYVVSEYFEISKYKGMTKLVHHGTCSSNDFIVVSRIKRSRKFCNTKKNGSFVKKLESFFID